MPDQTLPPAGGQSQSRDADLARLKGKTVYSSGNHPIGTIAAVFHPGDEAPPIPMASPGHYFLLTDTRLTSPDGAGPLSMPASAVTAVDGDRVVIGWTRDEVEDQGWANRPMMIDDARRT